MSRRWRWLSALVVPAALLTLAPVVTPAGAAPSAPGAGTALHVRLMSYNLLRIERDGTQEGDGTVAPWSQRRDKEVALIHAADPDVITVQEGSDWVGAERGPRQVDSLVSALGGDYALADTEIPPSQPHYKRTGRYILYKAADFKPVGSGGHWYLQDLSWAAYQVLASRATGQAFLVVSVHLVQGRGLTYDKKRLAETKYLYGQAHDLAQKKGVPVVFAGDWNSDKGKHVALNAPRKVMLQHNMRDAHDIAGSRKQAKFNSGNQYYRRPPAYGIYEDQIYVPHGVHVRLWREYLKLSGGKFVGAIPSDHNPIVADLVFR